MFAGGWRRECHVWRPTEDQQIRQEHESNDGAEKWNRGKESKRRVLWITYSGFTVWSAEITKITFEMFWVTEDINSSKYSEMNAAWRYHNSLFLLNCLLEAVVYGVFDCHAV